MGHAALIFSASSPSVSWVDAGVPGVAKLFSPGGVIAGAVVGEASGIGPQPASTAQRMASAITDGRLLVRVMTPSIAARSRGRFTVHLPGKGTSTSEPN